jgi:predicted transcriptional regulator
MGAAGPSANALDESLQRWLDVLWLGPARHLLAHVACNQGDHHTSIMYGCGISHSAVNKYMVALCDIGFMKTRTVPRRGRPFRRMVVLKRGRRWLKDMYGDAIMLDDDTPIVSGFAICPLCNDWSEWVDGIDKALGHVGAGAVAWSSTRRPDSREVARRIVAAAPPRRDRIGVPVPVEWPGRPETYVGAEPAVDLGPAAPQVP